METILKANFAGQSQMNTPPRNYSTLIGTPYSDQDCWGIVVEFYQLSLGIQLNRYYDSIPSDRDAAKSIVYSNMGDFQEVTQEEKKFGDVILIKIFGVDSHIAVYLGEGKMLHSTIHSGCVIDRIDRWKHLIVGYYRVVKNDTAS